MKNEESLKKGDRVAMRDFPDKNHINWNFGIILKFNTDEDEALISTKIEEREAHLWTNVSNLKKIN